MEGKRVEGIEGQERGKRNEEEEGNEQVKTDICSICTDFVQDCQQCIVRGWG